MAILTALLASSMGLAEELLPGAVVEQVTPNTPITSAEQVPPSAQLQEKSLELILFEEIPTVVTASSVWESADESPALVYVITDKDIERMGARTLSDVLATVPGFSYIQDTNEYYSVYRGIYTSHQRTITILRDGQRLNPRLYGAAGTDYSLGLDNVKQIEIMRGPGGSLYGDSLTGVINIITKKGADVQGVIVKTAFGNYGQKRFAFVAGDENPGNKTSYLVSLSTYGNDGENAWWQDPRFPDATGDSYVYHFGSKLSPCYDAFAKVAAGDFAIAFSKRYSYYGSPRTSSGKLDGQINQRGSYMINGEAEGQSQPYENLDVFYTPTIAGISTDLRAFYTSWDNTAISAISTSVTAGTAPYQNAHGLSHSYGLKLKLDKSFDNLPWVGETVFTLGAETEYAKQAGNSFIYKETAPGSQLWSESRYYSNDNPEYSHAVYGQVKCDLTSNVILNSGIRYDLKQRAEDPEVTNRDISAMSPRMALIYTPIPGLILKGSYFKSFLDATFHTRNSLLSGFYGSKKLTPEKVDIYQASVTHRMPALNLTNELNFFTANYTDVIYRNATQQFVNAGIIKNWGLEYEAAYKTELLSAKANATYQEAYESVGYFPIQNNMIENIPKYMGNVILDYAPFYRFEGFLKNLTFNGIEHYIGNQYSRWGKSMIDPRTDIAAVWITDLGFVYKATERLTFQAHAKNVFDTVYFQGGNFDYPMQQPGLWYLAEVSYKF